MRKLVLLAIVTMLLQNEATPQSGSAGFNQVLSRIDAVKKNRPVEDAYLHFDKPYYASGDTIYFKAYVTMNEQRWPTPLSEVLHVDLIDPMDRIIHSIRLKLKQGTGYGDLALADTLSAGNYRVRAYTRWMLNEGNTSFFNRVIPVGSETRPARQRRITDVHAQPLDIRFFPEGGELIAGIETKVAFKVTGKNGLGIKARGIVTDNTGKEITRFQTAHLGMGFFYLKPEAGKTYGAKLTAADGATETTALPAAMAGGMTLSVDNDIDPGDSAIVHILSSEGYLKEHQGEDIVLLIHNNGASSVTRDKLSAADMAFAIDKRNLRSGIARITLFTAGDEPVSERLMFIKNRDLLNLDIKSDKAAYGKREKVEISLTARDGSNAPAQGNFSVSVVNDDLLKMDEENTILSQLLLSSEVKGYIEQPNYYFTHPGAVTDANLDLLLLTQGYRHFVWKELLRDKLPPLAYKAEKFLQIEGIVKSPSGMPAKNEPVTLKDAAGQGPELKAMTDSAGRFVFSNLDFTDTMRFIVTPASMLEKVILGGYTAPAVGASEGSFREADTAMTPYLKVAGLDHAGRDAARVKVLKPVTISKRRPEDDYYTTSLSGPGHADQVIQGSDFHGGGSLSMQLNGRLHGITFINGTPVLNSDVVNLSGNGITARPMVVVLDGVLMDSTSAIDEIPLPDVATVEVLSSGIAAIYGMQSGGEVLVITTKAYSREVDNSPDPRVAGAMVMGFYKARAFYTPEYPAVAGTDKSRDLRTTLVWKPEVMTDKDGHAFFDFYNGDIEGVYRVVVEGIDRNGNPGRQIYTYRVR